MRFFVLWLDGAGNRRVLPGGESPGEDWRKHSGLMAEDLAAAERGFAAWDEWERERARAWGNPKR